MGIYKQVADTFKSTFDALTGGSDACDDLMRRRVLYLHKDVVDSAASDTTAAYAATATDQTSDAVYCPLALTVYAAYLMPMVAKTADGSNYGTVTVVYDDGAGGADTTIASQSLITAGGDWVVGTAKTMTLGTTGGVAVPAGSWLSFAITKTGTGITIPPFRIALVGKLT